MSRIVSAYKSGCDIVIINDSNVRQTISGGSDAQVIGCSSTTVSVKRGNWIEVYNFQGRIISSNQA